MQNCQFLPTSQPIAPVRVQKGLFLPTSRAFTPVRVQKGPFLPTGSGWRMDGRGKKRGTGGVKRKRRNRKRIRGRIGIKNIK